MFVADHDHDHDLLERVRIKELETPPNLI